MWYVFNGYIEGFAVLKLRKSNYQEELLNLPYASNVL
jgi:hypothetical protein